MTRNWLNRLSNWNDRIKKRKKILETYKLIFKNQSMN